jgi:hypothetical protein
MAERQSSESEPRSRIDAPTIAMVVRKMEDSDGEH